MELLTHSYLGKPWAVGKKKILPPLLTRMDRKNGQEFCWISIACFQDKSFAQSTRDWMLSHSSTLMLVLTQILQNYKNIDLWNCTNFSTFPLPFCLCLPLFKGFHFHCSVQSLPLKFIIFLFHWSFFHFVIGNDSGNGDHTALLLGKGLTQVMHPQIPLWLRLSIQLQYLALISP